MAIYIKYLLIAGCSDYRFDNKYNADVKNAKVVLVGDNPNLCVWGHQQRV